MAGIKETKEAVIFGVALANVVDQELSNGFQFTDIVALIPVLTKAPAAISGAGEIPAEIKDLDEAERAELVAVIESMDLKSDYSEAIAEQSTRTLIEIGKLATLVKRAKV
jgi:hypothetical protein